MQNSIHLIANSRLAFTNNSSTVGIRYNRYVITLPKFTYSSLVFKPEIAFDYYISLPVGDKYRSWLRVCPSVRTSVHP